MNDFARRIIMDRRMRDRDYRRGGGRSDYGRGQYEGEFRGDYESDYARGGRGRGSRGSDYGYYDDEAMYDGRQGVKGTGPYGIGGRRYSGGRGDRAGGDYADYDYARGGGDRADYGEEMRLTKHDMMMWKEKMENPDGSYGEHFTSTQIKQAVQSLGVQMNGYNEKELCLAANMLYSDYSEVLKPFIPREKEAVIYVNMARAFLDDPDAAVQGGEKLAAYYYAIVDDDEE